MISFLKTLKKFPPCTFKETLAIKSVVSYACALVYVLVSAIWVTVTQLAVNVSNELVPALPSKCHLQAQASASTLATA